MLQPIEQVWQGLCHLPGVVVANRGNLVILEIRPDTSEEMRRLCAEVLKLPNCVCYGNPQFLGMLKAFNVRTERRMDLEHNEIIYIAYFHPEDVQRILAVH